MLEGRLNDPAVTTLLVFVARRGTYARSIQWLHKDVK